MLRTFYSNCLGVDPFGWDDHGVEKSSLTWSRMCPLGRDGCGAGGFYSSRSSEYPLLGVAWPWAEEFCSRWSLRPLS